MRAAAITLLLAVAALAQCPPNDIPETAINEAYSTMEASVAGFSFELLRALHAQGSVFLSPLSIWSALALVFLGARGGTERELSQVLGVPVEQKAEMSRAYHNLLNVWNTKVASGDLKYRLANRLYFANDVSLDECFDQDFPTEIAHLDFQADPESARKEINSWVERETEDRIHEVVPPDGITAFTKMVIANAVYFRGKWLQMFDQRFTKRLRFTTSDLKVSYVDTMYLRGSFYYSYSDEHRVSIIELPYAGKEMSMLILLPQNYVSGLKRLIASLTPEMLASLMGNMEFRDVTVYVPKFRVESQMELSGPLARMGVMELWNPVRSNLTGFSADGDLNVDAVHHSGYVDVSEEGTEAAAATVLLASRTARVLGPAAFIADRPFLFLIKDNIFNLIVFMGTVQKPEYP